jgi:glyoxylase-like metal-dependent hydrolase (beta-lactamase superfamily II)
LIEEIMAGLYRIEVPLPRSPLKYLNCYVIKGDGRHLIVDTGMNRPECRSVLETALKALNADPARTDFFLTHFHSDHVGLISEMKTPSSRAFLSAPDAAVITNPAHWDTMAGVARMNGFPEEALDEALRRHPGRKYLFRGTPEFHPLKEGDEVRIGPYGFRCIETPGHTPGHLCLFEPKSKILFSGDHLLEEITPNISRWFGQSDALGEYLESLDKIRAFDIDFVLPGHRAPFRHARKRVDEIKEHHRERNREVLSILESGPGTAYEVASRMSWSIDCEAWDDFPLPQKWFASGEALSHLQYLEGRGLAGRSLLGGKACFHLP